MRKLLPLAAGLLLIASAAIAGQPRVDVCHKGQSITVAEPAVPAHLAHGDIICCEGETCTPEGTCVGENGCYACSCGEQCQNLCPPCNQAAPQCELGVCPNPDAVCVALGARCLCRASSPLP
jgi:hypothetical protein